MMDQLVCKLPAQLLDAIRIGQAATLRPHNYDFHHIFVAGMGASGIGANFVSEFIQDECLLPYLICKDYQAPAYLGKNTLAIASCYGGQTEETLNVFEDMLRSGAKVVVIGSGGQLIEQAKKHNLDYIQIPADWPSARACLGYFLVQQLFILHKLGLISDVKIKQVSDAFTLLEEEESNIKSEAMSLATFLNGKIPILYSTGRLKAVAIRLRQQINENAKMLCWHHVIPEMNHNELVGWRQENEQLAVLYLRSHDDFKRNQTRIKINKNIIGGYTHAIRDIFAKGEGLVEQSLYLVYLSDWVSVYLAELRGIDAVENKVVDYLKKELGRT